MSLFEDDKADKLARIMPLRVINMLGMVHWEEDEYHCANQKLRLLHPLSGPWALAIILVAVFSHGVPAIVVELKSSFREECVWW